MRGPRKFVCHYRDFLTSSVGLRKAFVCLFDHSFVRFKFGQSSQILSSLSAVSFSILHQTVGAENILSCCIIKSQSKNGPRPKIDLGFGKKTQTGKQDGEIITLLCPSPKSKSKIPKRERGILCLSRTRLVVNKDKPMNLVMNWV